MIPASCRHRSGDRVRGFTLLELLVVLMVFGIFAAMAYGGLNYVLDARRRLETSAATVAQWQRAFQRLRNDFQLVSLRTARNSYDVSEPPLRYEEYGARVDFTHAGWRNPLLAPRSTLERVTVRYDEKEKQLLRESYGALDRADDKVVRKQVLLDNVIEVRWRFMSASYQWSTELPNPQPPPPGSPVRPVLPGQTPMAVELTVTSPDFSEVRWVFQIGETAMTPGSGSTSSTSGGSTSSSGD